MRAERAPRERLDVLFVIRSLNRGGAERQLTLLASNLCKNGYRVAVATFYAEGELRSDLEDAGVTLMTLSKRSRWDLLRPFLRLIVIVRRHRPAVVHGYLTDGNLAALTAKLAFSHDTRIAWGIRASDMDLAVYGWFARASFWVSARTSRFADVIICNSEAGRRFHAARGYATQHMIVIANGIDTSYFRPPASRAESTAAPVVCVPARLDPMKDHGTMLRATVLLRRTVPGVRVRMVGGGPPGYLRSLRALADDLGVGAAIDWAGEQSHMAEVYGAADVTCLSSAWGEGFPNVVAESMACGTPAVVTDVGDGRVIVDSVGEVVRAGDPVALAEAVERLLRRVAEDPGLRTRARRWIEVEFSIDRMVQSTERALALVAG